MSMYMPATFSISNQEKVFTASMCKYHIIVNTGGVDVEYGVYVYSPLEAQYHPGMM